MWTDLLFLGVRVNKWDVQKSLPLAFNFSGGNGFSHFYFNARCARLSTTRRITIICVASTGFPSLYSTMPDAGENLPRII